MPPPKPESGSHRHPSTGAGTGVLIDLTNQDDKIANRVRGNDMRERSSVDERTASTMSTSRRQKNIVTPLITQPSNDNIAVAPSRRSCTNIGHIHDEVDLCSSSDSEEDDLLFGKDTVSVFAKGRKALPMQHQRNDFIRDQSNHTLLTTLSASKSSFVSPSTKAISAIGEVRNSNKALAPLRQTRNKDRGTINNGVALDSCDSDEDDLLFGNSISVFSKDKNRLPMYHQRNITTQAQSKKSISSAQKSPFSSSTKAISVVEESLGKPRCHQSPPKSKAASPSVDAKKSAENVHEERQRHLNGIVKNADKALQLLLWDIGFQYNIYAHQFEAVRFVAGLVPTFPIAWRKNESSARETICFTESASRRSKALAMAASESTNLRELSGSDERHILLTKGMILADEMGLGKTIEALAGAALRNAMMCDYDDQTLPTLIVSPQDGIQNQWYETLIKSGVKPTSISIWGETKIQIKKRQRRYEFDADVECSGNHIDIICRDAAKCSNNSKNQKETFILCTRYNIQSELRKLFDGYQISNTSSTGDQWKRKRELSDDYKDSSLFRNVPFTLIGNLRNQYLADKGKEKNKFILPKEKCQDCIARLVRNGTPAIISKQNQPTENFTFQTIIVDEAHFCKNVLAYWGLGLSLLGMQSKRTVLLTGTPYNNGPSDMSALMTYIDPTHDAAKLGWWEDAVTCSSNQSDNGYQPGAADAVSEWRKCFLLRRTKDILLQKLPPRHKAEIDVGAIPSELWIYQAYEGKFLRALRRLKKNMEDASPEARYKMKKVFEIMMACMACMRMALVHPILPGGREMTIQFSPSRRHLLKREERPNKCVFCESDPSRVAEEAAKQKASLQNQESSSKNIPEQNYDSDDGGGGGVLGLTGNARTDMDLDDDRLDDNDFEENRENKPKKRRKFEEMKKGPIVPLGPDFCQARGSQCQHFAHVKCIETRRRNGDLCCPRCHDLKNRLHGKLRNRVYCEEICTHVGGLNKRGFTSSAKIEEAIKWFQTVPKNDKAIILSFFKGSLDLVEGILVSRFGIDCARYDGDVGKDIRTQDLERFKTSSTCRVLLATVQSGGTGLNITEANHVCFLDRWFNPCVHDQAESRCHRIGQKKDVNIAYLDINFTVDIVMKRINVLKEGNASVVLADGTSLGDRWSLGYRNVSGVIGNTLNALRDMRDEIVKTNGDKPLPPYVESDLEQKLQGTTNDKARPYIKHEGMKQNFEPESDREKKLQRTINNKARLSIKHEEIVQKFEPEEESQSQARAIDDFECIMSSKNLYKSKDSNASMAKTEQKHGINASETKPKSFPLYRNNFAQQTSQNNLNFSSKNTHPEPRKIRSEIDLRLVPTKRMGAINVSDMQPKPLPIYANTFAHKSTLRDYPNLSANHNHPESRKVLESVSASMKSRSIAASVFPIPSTRRPISGHSIPTTNYAANRATTSSFERKRPTSSIPAARAQAPPIRNRYFRGLSAIVSQKRKTKEFMRRKRRGDI